MNNPVIIGNATLHLGDCISTMAGMADNSLDAIICDPPYLISFMGRSFDSQHKSLPGDNEGQKMQEWHRRWVKEAYRILKPGGHLAAFGGDRTHHRLMSAMEDVGFELRQCGYWIFSTGFPKSQDASKALDQYFGMKDKREVLETIKKKPSASFDCHEGWVRPWAEGKTTMDITEPAHPLAKQYAGYGTALKPATEIIAIGRKPMIGTLAENLLTWGTGAMNLDASRVKSEDQLADDYVYRRLSSLYSSVCGGDLSPEQLFGLLEHIVFALRSYSTVGIDHSHNEVCQDDILLEVALYENLVARLFPNGVWCGRSSWSIPDFLACYQSYLHLCDAHIRLLKEAAQGGSPLLADALERTCLNQPLLERNRESLSSDRLSNSDDFLLALSVSYIIGEYCTLYSSPQISQGRFPPHLLHDGSDVVKKCFPDTGASKATEQSNDRYKCKEYAGEGYFGTRGPENSYTDSGSSSRFFPSLPYDEEDCATIFYCAKASRTDRNQGCENIDQNKYSHDGRLTEIENPYQRNQSVASNFHVSVKPTSLMRWICRLLTPKGGTLLDPFMGSGSTLKAAVLENFTCIGIEMDADYFAIAEARVAHVSPEIVEVKHERVKTANYQPSLF